MSEKKRLNFIQRNIDVIYNIGAAIVILGALFKIEHITIGPIDGGIMLTVGLIAEALVFTLSAFEKNDDGLALESHTEVQSNQVEGISSGNMTNAPQPIGFNAVLDEEVLEKLSSNIKNLQNASEALSDSVKINEIIKQYNEEMTRAVSHFSALNAATEMNLKSSSASAHINAAIVEKSKETQDQLEALNGNLKSLNQVYQGMLSAMEKK